MRDRLFGLFFACTICGTFISGFAVGKRLQSIQDITAMQVDRTLKSDKNL